LLDCLGLAAAPQLKNCKVMEEFHEFLFDKRSNIYWN
jgi:hypothetical protein